MNPENNPAYPEELQRLENEWLTERQKAVGETRSSRNYVGIGLSGGGIRSATICLGVFQALARHKLLHHVDYLSSVSGGGYFAAFLGRLFGRNIGEGTNKNNAAAVEALLAANPDSPPVRNVRDFGRYIAPGGAGDVLNILAIFLRNWLTIHLVLGVAILAAFMLCIFIRIFLTQHGCSRPYLWLLAAVGLFWSIPCGWAYWIPPKTRWSIAGPAWGLLIAVGLFGILLTTARFHAAPGKGNSFVWAIPTVVADCTVDAHWRGRWIHPAPSFSMLQSRYRNRLSRGLQNSLIALLTVLISPDWKAPANGYISPLSLTQHG